MSALVQGVRNFWRFRKEVWSYRGWDYAYSYRLFVRAIELQAEYIDHHKRHVTHEVDVAGIKSAMRAWERYSEEDGTLEDWEEFHAILRVESLGWWD